MLQDAHLAHSAAGGPGGLGSCFEVKIVESELNQLMELGFDKEEALRRRRTSRMPGSGRAPEDG